MPTATHETEFATETRKMAADCGWTEASQLVVLHRFLSELSDGHPTLVSQYRAFLAKQAEEEDEMALDVRAEDDEDELDEDDLDDEEDEDDEDLDEDEEDFDDFDESYDDEDDLDEEDEDEDLDDEDDEDFDDEDEEEDDEE